MRRICEHSFLLACFLLRVSPARGEPVDLLKRYPTELTAGDTAPERARPWEFTSRDMFRLSRFSLVAGTGFRLEVGAADLAVGHCADGAVWAVIIPRAGGKLTSQATNEQELIAHVWLRFHPREIVRLFPPATVFADGATNLAPQVRVIAGHKFMSSWHSGERAMIPEPKDVTVDVDTEGGLRRFFAVDLEAGRA